MKKLILSGIGMLCMLSLTVKSQTTIADPGFENWSNDHELVNWDNSNVSTTYLGVGVTITCVTKSTDVHSGSFSAKILSKDTTIVVITTPVTPGFVTLGTFWFNSTSQTGGVVGGIPFSGRPDSITFWYKSSLQGSDKSSIYFEEWQGAHTTTIADDSAKIATSATDWTYFAMPINYQDAGIPDSMNLTIGSSDLGDQAVITNNSQMNVDDVSLVYGDVGIMDIAFSANFNVYADQSTNQLIIDLNFDQSLSTEISLYNVAGQVIKSYVKNIKTSKELIGLDSLPKGIYFVKVTRKDGQNFSQKISVN
jgi:hypothetical protein